MSDPKTDAQLWAALLEMSADDLLCADTPMEHVDAALRDAGVDPDDIGKRGVAFVAELASQRRRRS